MYQYRTGLGQVWVGAKLPPNPGSNIIWLRPSDDHRVLWEIRTYNIYKERWEVLTSAALTADGLLILIRDLEKRCKSLEELKVVLYDTVQNLTPEEQKIARQNIGAISVEDLPPQVEVVQDIGNSTTSVMSQKAVTRELFTLDTQIDNLSKLVDENVTRLAVELTVNNGGVYSVVTPLETLTEHYRKFLADPTKYVWQLYLKIGEDQLGLVPMFTFLYGGLHIGFYSPDMSGEMKRVWLSTNGDVVDNATVDNYGPTLVEVVQNTGSDLSQVMSQDAVTKALQSQSNTLQALIDKCTVLPTYDSSTYKLSFKTINGATLEIDLPIEELGLSYNAEAEAIEFTNHAGEVESIPVSAFVKIYTGSIGDAIQISIDNNNVIRATLLNNSINYNHLSRELQEKIDSSFNVEELKKHAVVYDAAQTLTASQKSQARRNINAADADYQDLIANVVDPTIISNPTQATDLTGLSLEEGSDFFIFMRKLLYVMQGSTSYDEGNLRLQFAVSDGQPSDYYSLYTIVGWLREEYIFTVATTDRIETYQMTVGAGDTPTSLRLINVTDLSRVMKSGTVKGVEVVQGTAPMQQDNILYIELEETT